MTAPADGLIRLEDHGRSVFQLAVHPAADVFPMMSNEDLDELAADIKANGLLHPIIVNGDLLIDGRNRREACRRANVDPRIEELNGTDPIAYILATNVNRRHLTKGQRSMAVAKLYPVSTEKGGRGKTTQMNWGVSPDWSDKPVSSSNGCPRSPTA